MSRRMLVLGAGGFIGRSLVEHVLRSGGPEMVLHYRDTTERLAIGMNLESHVLDVVTCPMAALAEMFDRTSRRHRRELHRPDSWASPTS